MKSLLFVVVCFVSSCSTGTHMWEGQKVSKKQYDKQLKKYTINYIKNTSPNVLQDISNLKVTYDTLSK